MNHVCVPEEVYFGLYNKIGRLTEENRNLKHLNENQLNMIMDLRNEIADLKKQKEGLCELVGKTKKERKDYEAMQNELRSLQDENAARIEAYEQLDNWYTNLYYKYSKLMGENAACAIENYRLRRKLDNGCNTCPDMENTKKKNDELRDAAKKSAETIEVLNDSIGQLRRAIAERDEGIKYWADEAHKAQRRIAEMIYKGDSDASEAALKDADAKIQSANDKATNAKEEAKQAKETAERYRKENFVLHRQIDQFKKLNDELIKELARQQNAELIPAYSTDGITWTSARMPVSASWALVSYGNSKFVAMEFDRKGED